MKGKLNRTLSISATIVTMILGIMVIIGWLTHNDFLRSIIPGAVKMKFNVALGFIFSSIVLLLYHFQKGSKIQRPVSILLCIIIFLTGLLTLAEYIFGVNLGIDELFARDELRTTTIYYAGRMSPISALNFLQIGIGLLLLDKEKTAGYQFFYLFEIAFVALLMLVSFNFVTDISTFFRLAIHGAIGFITLPIAIYFAQPILQKKMNFEYLMFAGFMTVILLTLVISVFSSYYSNERIRSSRLVDHSNIVLNKAEKILSLAKDIESGGRGYVITSDSIYLDHFKVAKNSIFNHIDTIRELTKDNPVQQTRIDSLLMQVNKRIDFSGNLVQLRNEKGFDAANRLLTTSKDQRYADSLRKLTIEIQQDENDLLVQRRKKNTESILAFNYTFHTLLISLVILLVIIFLVIRYILIERKNAEEQLKKTNELLFNLFEHNPASIVISRLSDAKIIRVNEAFLSSFGFSNRDEVLNKTARELNIVAHPEQREELAQLLKKNKVVKDFEIEAYTKQGKVFWISTSILIFDVENESCLFSISIDISNRKIIEREIQKQKQDIQAFIDSMSTLCAKVSTDGKILLANKIALLGTGLSMEELLNTNFLEGKWWTFNSDVHLRVCEAFKKACSGTVINYDENIFVFDNVLTINFSLIPISGSDGSVDYIVAEGRDISSLKVTETALLKQTDQLEIVNKELEAFSYSVSHDLRSPLRAIHGYTKIISNEYASKLDDDGKEMMGSILHNAKKMSQLIDDLLEFSKIGKKDLQISYVDMTEIANTVFQDLRDSLPSLKAKVTVHPLLSAYTDKNLIRQVFSNLISNAIKYSGTNQNSEVEIKSFYKEKEIIYCVKDNGVGFDMKYSDKLFGVFQRLHSSKEFEGTGVGLALVKRIIMRHGGRVWAEAEIGKGATFYFSLKRID